MNVSKEMTNLHSIKSSVSFLYLTPATELDVSGPVLNYSVSWQALRIETLYVEEIPGAELDNIRDAPSPRLMPCMMRCLFYSLSLASFLILLLDLVAVDLDQLQDCTLLHCASPLEIRPERIPPGPL